MKNVLEIREFYLHLAYIDADSAHGIDHIDQVYKNAVNILKTPRYASLDKHLVTLSVYIHDMFTNVDRTHHHMLAKNYVLNRSDSFLKPLTNTELSYIAHAVAEHRSSINTPPSSLYVE